jgi:hypothetical protein
MIIYKATNTIDGKVYIGQTRGKLKNRIKGHKYTSKIKNAEFQKAIREFGIE